MISFGSNTKVYLAIGATDMRKAVNGLMVLVQEGVGSKWTPLSSKRSFTL